MKLHRSIAGLGPKDAESIKAMWLPEGKTCADCVHVKRCTTLFGSQADDVDCQFSPPRFHEPPPPARLRTTEGGAQTPEEKS